MSAPQAIEYARSQHKRYLAEFIEFLSIPSVSTLSEHKPDMLRAADWVARQMTNMGLQNVAVLPTAGHPVVYGDWLHAPGKPTVLCYGHYDVQPPDPLDLWVTPDGRQTVLDEDELEELNPEAELRQQIYAGLRELQERFSPRCG